MLHTGLRYPQTLAGILALSTYLPLVDSLAGEAAAANRSVPLMMAHGTEDPLVPVARAMLSRTELQQRGYSVEWHSYPMQHAVCPDEVRDIRDWLMLRLEAGMA